MSYIHFNNNPLGKNVGDCAVRAVSKAFNTNWDDAYMELAIQGLCMGDLPNSDSVWGSYLFLNGFQRYNLNTECPDCYTVKDFCFEHPVGTFVLGTGSHAVCVINGNYYDSFDSGNEILSFAWKREV